MVALPRYACIPEDHGAKKFHSLEGDKFLKALVWDWETFQYAKEHAVETRDETGF